MAKAVNTLQEVVSYEGEVILTLSRDEAITLHDVMRAIGGDPKKSRRAYTDAISRALRMAGVPNADYPVMDMAQDANNIYFNDKE